MIDFGDIRVIHALYEAGWAKIEKDDVVINRKILQSLVFQASTEEQLRIAQDIADPIEHDMLGPNPGE
jgi:hypothetical protein